MNNFFNRNLTAKIISILFALVMWTYVMGEINPPVTQSFNDVPVQLENLDLLKEQGLVMVGNTEHNIRVVIKGRRDEVYSISKEDIKASIDLLGYRIGTNTIPVEINSFANIEIDFSPKTIRVELEEVIRRQKEVDLVISGKPKSGYVLNEAQFKPTMVSVEGPESFVNTVDRVVARLEVGEASENIVASLPLKAVNQKGQEITAVDVKTGYIDVYLPIDRLKTVKIEPNINAVAAPGYVISKIEIKPNQIAIRGQDEVISGLTAIETETLNFNNLTQNLEQEISFKLPEGVVLFDEEPVTLKIEVKPAVEKSFTLNRSNVTFQGLEEGLAVDPTSIPEEITLKMVLAEDLSDSIKESDIELVLDLAELDEGEHQIVPQVTIDGITSEQLKSTTIEPGSFNIRIIPET
ncbi:CdaR family protein [Alkaliphilus crotonatoxidans]